MSQIYWISKTIKDGYLLQPKSIQLICDEYRASYVGPFDLLNGTVEEVFYQPNPDVSKGHQEYFSFFKKDFSKLSSFYVRGAASIASAVFIGIVSAENEVVISRHRHEYRESQDRTIFIDGGRDYIRTGFAETAFVDSSSYRPTQVKVKIINGNYCLEDGSVLDVR